MARLLVTYASTHGHTARIARRIATVAREAGHQVTIQRLGAGHTPPDPASFDVVVAGASVHHGRHQRELEEWAGEHWYTLTHMPSAFFSVCLAVADGTEASRDTARGWVEDLLEDTGWKPRVTTSFAGALQYREYDPWTRLVMRLLMSRGGHTTDISRDHDYTDWEAVDAFAGDCAALALTVPH